MALQYRFMPWVRRGLSRTYATADMGAGLEARPPVQVGLSLQAALDGVPSAPVAGSVGMRIYGPADVIGIDSRLIVRTDPKPLTSNFEPNYLASVEFDPPDFAWMFMPAKADGSGRLRPWLVLLVLDRDNAGVALPQMRGGPLPRISLSASQAQSELPRLSQSWMWAHAQAASEATTPNALDAEMRQFPDQNISRLIAPRRLKPDTRYLACLVPAFECGRKSGLGQPAGNDPNAPIPLDPAWPDNPADRSDIDLPVYFHWEFSTGPLGDFETLARSLTTPAKYPKGGDLNQKLLKLGTAPVLLDADRLLTTEGVKKTVLYEGAMVSTTYESAAVPDADVAAHLSAIVNDPAAMNLAQGPADRVPTIAPPIYGGWHAKKHTVPASELNQSWLADLNLDPRYRLASGYGAEVVRQNQEEFMQACWTQVGDVLKAEMTLNLGRFARELGKSVVNRHLSKLPPERMLSVMSPARGRLAIAPQETVLGRIAKTSLPDAVIDPALRRFTSAQRPVLKAAIRRAGSAAVAVQVKQLFATLSAASKNPNLIDPTRFVPDGVLGTTIYDQLQLPPDPNATLDLGPILGIERTVRVGDVTAIRQDSAKLRRAGIIPRLKPTLSAVRRNGLLTETHHLQLATLQRLTKTTIPLHTLASELIKADTRGAEGMLMSIQTGAQGPSLAVAPLVIDGRSGTLQILSRSLLRTSRLRLAARALAVVKTTGIKQYGTATVFATLPPNTLPVEGGGSQVKIEATGAGAFRAVSGVAIAANVVTITAPAPIKDRATLQRVTDAFPDFLGALKSPIALAQVQIVATDFPLAATASSALAKVQPASTITARVLSMLSLDETRLTLNANTGDFTSLFVGRKVSDLLDDRIRYLIPLTFDRVMAYPQIPAPAYKPLADKMRDAFLPGAEDIPNDFVLLLATNPRFVESYMVGLNYEMGREMLWRGFPCDQRGTPFRQFWPRLDGKKDIEPIHRWTYWTAIGSQGAANAEQNTWLVLLIRGQLLKRFPNTVIYARKKSPAGNKLGTPQEFGVAALDDIIQKPVFIGALPPDMTFAGFPIHPDDRHLWCFVLEEQMTEPRFGFDEPGSNRRPANDGSWKDVQWPDIGNPPVPSGAHFGLTDLMTANPRVKPALQLGPDAHAADVAKAMLQRPFRGYWVGDDLVPKP